MTKTIAFVVLGAASLALPAIEGIQERIASSVDDAHYGSSHSEGTKR